MSEKPISPLRQRMLDDMNMRRFVPDTQREYIRAVKKLASFLGRSPDTATALRFFFKVTLDRPETTRHLVFVYEPRKLRRVLSPEEVLRLLENSRLIAVDQRSVTFKVKDYRIGGPRRYTTMTLDVGEFIRRFLIHVLPKGFHRIRHYGLFASANRAETIARARELLGPVTPAAEAAVEIDPAMAQPLAQPCPCCGGRMFVIETFEAGYQPRHQPTAPLVAIRIDTS